MSDEFRDALVEAAAAPYRAAGRFAWHFARSKLRRDPVFVGLLAQGLVPDARRLVDLGCGQGLLASWLAAARGLHAAGTWPAGWPAPPRVDAIVGVELMPRDVERARRALGAAATFARGDMRTFDFGRADVVVILDVLHYVGHADQEALLRRVHAALRPGGVLLARIGDAAGGWPFRASVAVDHAVALARGHGLGRMYCRPADDWSALLRDAGFTVGARPMNANTPFANTLLVARTPASGPPVANVVAVADERPAVC